MSDAKVQTLAASAPELRAIIARLERELAEARPTVHVRIGDSCLTRDLVWCECGRGLSLSGKWEYCPKCGGKIDQAAYLASIEKAEANGAKLYQDEELVEQKQKAKALDALAAWSERELKAIDIGKDGGSWHFYHYRGEGTGPDLAAAIMDALRKARA